MNHTTVGPASTSRARTPRAASRSPGPRAPSQAPPASETRRNRGGLPQANREDVLALARRRWLRGERADVGALAEATGLGRATLFRWFGTREALHGELLWSAYAPLLAELATRGRGRGARRILAVVRTMMERIRAFAPLMRWLDRDPAYALGIISSRASPIQARTVAWVEALIAEEIAAGTLRPPLKTATLAYTLVRIVESFLYGRFIADRDDDPREALAAIKVLLGA